MHKIYIGYSLTMNDDELIEYFDLDGSHPDLDSKFQQEFGFPDIEQGNFEVYGRDFYKEYSFGKKLFLELLPFHISDDKLLNKINFEESKSLFYIESNHLRIISNDNLTIVGEMLIEKFNYEI